MGQSITLLTLSRKCDMAFTKKQQSGTKLASNGKVRYITIM